MFNALQNFDTLNTKDKMLTLLDIAEVLLEHDATIDGLTIDDTEAEDAFEEVRSVLRTAVDTIDYYVD
jgi:hypothetical protein